MFDTLSCTTFGEGVMINADTLDVLKEMNDDSTTLIISDPPYGAQTHNQQDWDVSWSPAFWKDVVTESFRVLKKGGHLVVFASGKDHIRNSREHRGGVQEVIQKGAFILSNDLETQLS